MKLNPEKIASLAMSELMKLIMGTLFQNSGGRPGSNSSFSDEFLDAHEFIGINWKTLCTSISKMVNAQCVYEKEEKEFKEAQKIHDKLRTERRNIVENSSQE